MCTTNMTINTQLRLTYSPSLIHPHKYAYLLTESLLHATRLLKNVLFLKSQFSVMTLIWCAFQPRLTLVARKRPRSFCQKYRRHVTFKHAYTLHPPRSNCAEYATVKAECANVSDNDITLNTSGNTPSQTSDLAENMWTDPGLISVRVLIFT